jgi:Tol biopolymer transport system component
MRKLIVLSLLAGLALAALFALPAGASAPGVNGQIVFSRFDPAAGDTFTYTVNPDGSHVQQLFSAHPSNTPHWSPDGSEVAIFCCDDGMAAHFVNPDTGSFREVAPPDPTLETHCGFSWSPDGQRLTCESFGVTDPSRTGVYSIRASDGGGLTRITSSPPGGDDVPGDYSPHGKRLVFVRLDENGPVGLFVTKLNGSGLRQITPPGMVVQFYGGSWSPTGNKILFAARTDPDHRLAVWIVRADGSGLHQVPITPSCGGAFSDARSISCLDPDWSPDGTKIAFTRVTQGTPSSLYTVNADGSGLSQVTNARGDSQPDWGPHQLVP